MSCPSRKITILYGSQTGTAQEVAERIWRESRRFHFHGPVMPMDDFPVHQLIYEHLVIFVCSTTGQGEEPDNMKRFWKFLLRKSLPLNSLTELRFGVLGLGDSSYLRFNYAAKKLNQRLLQLGGKMLQSAGLADDQHDLGADAAVDPWITTLWYTLANLYPLPDDVQLVDKSVLCPPRWQVSVMEKNVETTKLGKDITKDAGLLPEGIHNEANIGDLHSDSFESQVGSSNSVVKYGEGNSVDKSTRLKSGMVTVLRNTRITKESHFQDVRLIEFAAPGISYIPGDVLSVVPRNLPSNTEALFELLSSNEVNKLSADTVLKVAEIDSDIPLPVYLKDPITVGECAEKYWDLNAVPRRYLFQLLSHFTTSELESEKLLEFTTPEGQEELYSYANRPRRTVLETLLDFPHAAKRIPVEYLFELFQPIRPRAFSIASSPVAHKDQLHILVAVVNYQTRLVKPRLGLCSNWLANLKLGNEIHLSIRSGSFSFPKEQKLPIIMIGPGTGVAPFRSFINDTVAMGKASAESLYLFFGCRNKDGDFHCKEEWGELQSNKQLCMFCAFSRDQEHKVYVQHLINEHSSLLWELIWEKEAYIFLAGSANNMPGAVKDSFIFNVGVKHGLSVEEATAYYKELENNGRYQCETWS